MVSGRASTPSAGWRLVKKESSDGIRTYSLSAWPVFFEFLESEIFNREVGEGRGYVWRGQRRSDWSISSSLDRLLEKLGKLSARPAVRDRISARHLESFAFAARGRRGVNPRKLDLRVDENEWWALGQHFGLATPLLDWTQSPFAAAYFAFEEAGSDRTKYRVVYGLDRMAVQRTSDALANGPPVEGRMPVVEFIEPMSDENQRLVSQSGLFTRSPIGVSIEQWVARAFEGSKSAVLLRIRIPDKEREVCLRALNRMNINHLSLFPDLSGASRFTNLKLELEPKD